VPVWQLKTVIELAPQRRDDEATTPGMTVELWVAELLKVWETIERRVLALTLLELPIMLGTGALRIALINTLIIAESTFPHRR
jgi:hypothetical protein